MSTSDHAPVSPVPPASTTSDNAPHPIKSRWHRQHPRLPTSRKLLHLPIQSEFKHAPKLLQLAIQSEFKPAPCEKASVSSELSSSSRSKVLSTRSAIPSREPPSRVPLQPSPFHAHMPACAGTTLTSSTFCFFGSDTRFFWFMDSSSTIHSKITTTFLRKRQQHMR